MTDGARKKHSTSCDDFIMLGSIGTGTFGVCSKVMRKSDRRILVWKELNYGKMTEREKQMLVSEVNILRELRHENIVRYYDRIIDRSRTTIYIVMEYCEGGDLASLIQKRKKSGNYFDENFIRKVFRQILLALQECHKRTDGKVMHRDLKPANIFLDKDHNAKLGDFGLARVLGNKTALAHTFVGTPYYMSPEQITERAYNEKSDMWSLGCIIYELAALRPPFDASCQASLARKIKRGKFLPLPQRYSRGLNDIVTSMLKQDYHFRPSAEELLQNHYFIQATVPEEELSPIPLCACCSRRVIRPEMWNDVGSNEDSSYSSNSSVQERLLDLQQLEATLKAREQSILMHERMLQQREHDLKMREKHLHQREQLFELARERSNSSGLSPMAFDLRLQKRFAGIGLQEITNIFP